MAALPFSGRDLFDQVTFARLARHDRRLIAFPAFEHSVERRHHIGAARLGGLMASLAVRLEDRANLLVVANLERRRHLGIAGFVLLRLIGGSTKGGHHRQGQQGPDPSDSASL